MQTKEELTKQYSEACVELGHLQYTKSAIEAELANVERKMDSLQNKMRDITKKANSTLEVPDEQPAA